jgi:hypothetical protein
MPAERGSGDGVRKNSARSPKACKPDPRATPCSASRINLTTWRNGWNAGASRSGGDPSLGSRKSGTKLDLAPAQRLNLASPLNDIALSRGSSRMHLRPDSEREGAILASDQYRLLGTIT